VTDPGTAPIGPPAEGPSPPAEPPLPAAPAPPPPADRWAHRRGEPRSFAALWILYLFGATVLSLGAVGLAGLLSTDVYRPAARTLLALGAFGIALVWPMIRLSQEAPPRPFRAAAADAAIVGVSAQALVWPQALVWMAAWPLPVALALAALYSAWTLLIGGLLATFAVVGREGPGAPARPLSRSLMMLLLVILVGAGPLVGLLRPAALPTPFDSVDGVLMSSPITGALEITRDRSWSGMPARVDGRHWLAIASAAAAGAGAWAVAAAVAGVRRRGGR